MITQTRKRLYLAAKAFAETGVVPPGSQDSAPFLRARAGDFFAPSNLGLREAYERVMRQSSNLTGRLMAAE